MNTDKIEIILPGIWKALNCFQDNWLALAAFVLSLISLLVTWWKNIKDRHYNNDKELVEQLKLSLEFTFKSLSTENGPPTNIRLRWLTAARHIVRFRELQIFIKTKLYKTICEEHEEYWRDKIYNLLAYIEDSSFFRSINIDEMEEEEIDIRSAAVVYSFSEWKEGRSDPLDNMSLENIILKYKLYSQRYRHFWDYVKKEKPTLADKVKGASS